MYNEEKFNVDVEYLKGLGLSSFEAKEFILNLIIDVKNGVEL